VKIWLFKIASKEKVVFTNEALNVTNHAKKTKHNSDVPSEQSSMGFGDDDFVDPMEAFGPLVKECEILGSNVKGPANAFMSEQSTLLVSLVDMVFHLIVAIPSSNIKINMQKKILNVSFSAMVDRHMKTRKWIPTLGEKKVFFSKVCMNIIF
jgi:hypothetical protein